MIQKWEYCSLEEGGANMDDLGEQGWELVQVVPFPRDYGTAFWLYFKRPVQPPTALQETQKP